MMYVSKCLDCAWLLDCPYPVSLRLTANTLPDNRAQLHPPIQTFLSLIRFPEKFKKSFTECCVLGFHTDMYANSKHTLSLPFT